MSVNANLVFERIGEKREARIDSIWLADGIVNKDVAPGEILTSIHIPRQADGHKSAYGKLRDRGSIDFPLLGCAVRLDVDDDGVVTDADLCAVALVAKPARVKGVADLLRGTTPGTPEFETAVEAVAQAAYKQCRPMDNVPGDAGYRREMVPVYVRRTVLAAANGSGPVHHV